MIQVLESNDTHENNGSTKTVVVMNIFSFLVPAYLDAHPHSRLAHLERSEHRFLRVAELEHRKPPANAKSTTHGAATILSPVPPPQGGSDQSTRPDAVAEDMAWMTHTDFQPSCGRHVWALWVKRWHIAKRDVKTWLLQFVLPCVIIALGLGLLRLPVFVAQNVNVLTPTAQYGASVSVPVFAGSLFLNHSSNPSIS